MLAKTDNARDIILSLREANPTAKRDDLFAMFQDELTLNPSARRSVDWYFFINMFEHIVAGPKRPPKVTEESARLINGMKERIKSNLVLLDLVMPNGKTMRECTGQEMATFGNRYQRIAERVGKTKIVGSVLDEAAVQAIMGSK